MIMSGDGDVFNKLRPDKNPIARAHKGNLDEEEDV